MQKIYTLALAALVAMGAQASTPQLKQLSGIKVNSELPAMSKKATATESLQKEFTAKAASKLLKTNAPAKAAELKSIEGTYTLTIGDYYFENSAGGYVDTEAYIEKYDESSIIIGSDFFISEVLALYDEETNTITFQNLKLGSAQLQDGSVYYVQFEPGIYVDEGNGKGHITNQSYSVTFDAETGTIAFPADYNFGWVAYTDSSYKTAAGYFDVFDVISFVPYNPNEGWEDWGEATFQDGWVLPAFGIDQTKAENWYKVPVQKSTEYEGVYRLVNPYLGNFPMVAQNSNTRGGYISFDISDPDHVYFGADKAGFTNTTAGLSDMYCYNTLTFLCLYENAYPTNIIQEYGAEIPYSTFNATEKVITVPCAKTASGYSPDACFGIVGEIDGGYVWQDNSGKPVNMEAKIFFDPSEKSGVADVIATEANGEKEYFNLQGVKVLNPSNGVYIVRQNGKATKQYIR